MSTAQTSASSDPTPQDIRDKIRKGFLALHVVTASCHAVRNTLLEPLTPAPVWFPVLSANLDTAKQHAGNWIDNMASNITASIPTSVIDTGSIFSAADDQIKGLLTAASAPGADKQDLLNQAM